MRDRNALPITRDYMFETEQRYRKIAAEPAGVKKPRSSGRKKAVETTSA